MNSAAAILDVSGAWVGVCTARGEGHSRTVATYGGDSVAVYDVIDDIEPGDHCYVMEVEDTMLGRVAVAHRCPMSSVDRARRKLSAAGMMDRAAALMARGSVSAALELYEQAQRELALAERIR